MSSGSLFQSVLKLCKSWRKIGARFAPNVPQAWKSFRAHTMVLLGVVSHVVVVLVSAQDRCTVCAECTSGREIILGTPDGTPS